jgi:serine acetyltransferase
VIGAGAIVVEDVPAGAVVLPERSRVVTAADARGDAAVDA